MEIIKTECSMKLVQAELKQLKSALEGPRLYMFGYFSDLINKVDMEFAIFNFLYPC